MVMLQYVFRTKVQEFLDVFNEFPLYLAFYAYNQMIML